MFGIPGTRLSKQVTRAPSRLPGGGGFQGKGRGTIARRVYGPPGY